MIAKAKAKAILPLLMAALLCLMACTGRKEIRIGVLLPQTGNARHYGLSILNGVRLAAEEINAEGLTGFAGMSLVLVERDTQSDPAVGRKALMELMGPGQEDCYAVIGPASSAVALSAAPVALMHKRVLLTPAASEAELTKPGDFVFRIYPSDAVEGRKMAGFARTKLVMKRMAVMAEATAYAQGLKKVFVKSFREQDGEILAIVNVPDGASDVTQYVEKVKAVNPQGVYVVGYDETLIRILGEIKRLGVVDDKGRDSKILSCGAFDSPVVIQQACEAADNVIFPRVDFSCESDSEEIQAFCAAYKAKFGRAPDTFSAHGYDAMRLLAHSIEVQGGLYPAEMPMVLATTSSWKGVSGSVSFDARGDVISKFPKVFIIKQCKAMSFDELMQELKDKEREKYEALLKELEERKKELGRR